MLVEFDLGVVLYLLILSKFIKKRNLFFSFIGFLIFFCNCNQIPVPIFPKGVSSVVTGWEGKRDLSSKECKNCHSVSHAEWQEGMHSRAWIDPLFQNAFAQERQEWCIHCHAPLQEQKNEFINPKKGYNLLNEGINCVSCHVRDGKVLGFKNLKNDFHEVIRFDYLKTSEFCENCHQFNFPRFSGKEIHYSKEPMQNTYVEWRNSISGRTCQDCHYDGHKLLGNHNPERLLKDFSDIEYEFSEKGLLHISFLINKNRGHVLPTGDLFHSIQLEVSLDSKFKTIYYKKKWARIYGLGKIGENVFWNRKLISNHGIQPEQDKINLTIDAPSQNKILYIRLVYYFHDQELGGRVELPPKEKLFVIREKMLKNKN